MLIPSLSLKSSPSHPAEAAPTHPTAAPAVPPASPMLSDQAATAPAAQDAQKHRVSPTV